MKMKPMDIIILILTLLVSIILVLTLLQPLIYTTNLPEPVSKILANSLGSVISIISMYIGAKIQQKMT
jgi:hypothetical protein